MKPVFKQMLSMLLVLVLLGALAGCQRGSQETTGPAVTAAAETTAPAQTEAKVQRPAATAPMATEPAKTEQTPAETEPVAAPKGQDAPAPSAAPAETEPTRHQQIDPVTGKDQYDTDPVPDGKPAPAEPEDATIDDTVTYSCTLSISCGTILDNMDLCDEPKRAIVPSDGVILPATTVAFSEGESVYDILQRVCRDYGIHMESSWTPMYNSAYIEGIANLYEFDVGSGSGWMYKVNEWFPNYGCSRYQVEDGDVICWVYTCDLGYDVGGGYAMG